MPDRFVAVDGPRGPIRSWVQVVDEPGTAFHQMVIVRDPHTGNVRTFGYGEEPRDCATEWQALADRGPVCSDDVTAKRVEYRAAMASWWCAVQAWIDEET